MDDQRGRQVEKMEKRREKMEDGRRYIIYYTFGAQKKKNDKPANLNGSGADDV
jgi:hypothetical protein